MNYKLKIVLAIIILWANIFGQNIEACTAFCLTDKNNYVIVGKNLDWSIGDGFIIVNPRHISKNMMNKQVEPEKEWIAKYGSVSFNQFGLDHPLGGMNEVGLVVEELSYSPTIYPDLKSNKKLNELQWIQYQLDSFCSVNEVIDNLSDIQIDKLLFGLHYFISDKYENSAIIEFIEGKLLVYKDNDLPYSVLSNNTYDRSIKYLQRHQGHGGNLKIREDSASQSRFVIVADLLKNKNYNHFNQVDYAFNILKKVRQEDTQWSIVYDISNMKICYSTKQSSKINKIVLEDINFGSDKILFQNILRDSKSEKTLDWEFIPLNINRNSSLVSIVMEKLHKYGLVESSTLNTIIETINNYVINQTKYLDGNK